MASQPAKLFDAHHYPVNSTSAAAIASWYRRSEPFTVTVRVAPGSGAVLLGGPDISFSTNSGYRIDGSTGELSFVVPAGTGVLDADDAPVEEVLYALGSTSGLTVSVFIGPQAATEY